MIFLIVIGLIAAALLVTIGYVIGSGMQREHMVFVAGECRRAKDERDMLHDYALDMDDRHCAAQKHLAEADAQLDLQVHQIHGLMEERKSLQLQLQEAQRPRKRTRGQAVTTGEDGAR